ncbi:MAG: CopG family transcriptional regulator [Candidatus Omnitrophota bacterium]
MIQPTKRATIYFDSNIHRILRVKAAETDQSISEIVNGALRVQMAEDREDLVAFENRKKEPSVSYQALLEKLKADGKI